MCCRAAHPIARDAQGRWGVVGWDPGCCSSAAAVELTGFRTWTPTPSFVSSTGTKSAMLILRGSRRFWARPSFHGTMERGTGAKLTCPRRCRANLMPSFDVEFLLSSGLGDSLPSQDSVGSCPSGGLQGQTKKTLQGSEPSFVKTLLSFPFPTCISLLSGNPVQLAPGHCSSRQARWLAGVEGLPAETWQLGVIDWWSTSTDRIGQPFCHRPTTVHLIKREGRTKTGQCSATSLCQRRGFF